MKYFVAIFVFAFVAAALADDARHEAAQKLKEAHEACNKDPALKVDKDDFEGGKKPENLGAHNLCVTKHMEWQNDDGSVNVAGMRAKATEHNVDPAKVDEFINKCAKPQDTPEATANHIIHCIFEAAKKHVADKH